MLVTENELIDTIDELKNGHLSLTLLLLHRLMTFQSIQFLF